MPQKSHKGRFFPEPAVMLRPAVYQICSRPVSLTIQTCGVKTFTQRQERAGSTFALPKTHHHLLTTPPKVLDNMLIYEDIISGDEMISDAYDLYGCDCGAGADVAARRLTASLSRLTAP